MRTSLVYSKPPIELPSDLAEGTYRLELRLAPPAGGSCVGWLLDDVAITLEAQ